MELHLKNGAHWKILDWTQHAMYADFYVANLPNGKEVWFTSHSLNYIED